jgi:hypothetical protein
MPSLLAVLRLKTNSNWVCCMTPANQILEVTVFTGHPDIMQTAAFRSMRLSHVSNMGS